MQCLRLNDVEIQVSSMLRPDMLLDLLQDTQRCPRQCLREDDLEQQHQHNVGSVHLSS